jgi:pimeloyl-ACP methyl ester carboxylesterase
MNELTLPLSDPDPVPLSTSEGEVAITCEGPADGPVVLCVHGDPGSYRDFRYLAPPLSGRFRVVRLNMPGFGPSPLGTVETVSGWSRVIIAVTEALGLERCLLLGHSFGGSAVIAAAARAPDRFAGLILIASVGTRRHRGLGVEPSWFRLFAAAVALAPIRPLTVRVVRWAYARRGLRPPAVAEWRRLHRQLRLAGSLDFPELHRLTASVRCPALVVHCDDDPIIEPAIAAELARTLPAAETLFLPSGGHHPQKTRAAVIGRAVECLVAP